MRTRESITEEKMLYEIFQDIEKHEIIFMLSIVITSLVVKYILRYFMPLLLRIFFIPLVIIGSYIFLYSVFLKRYRYSRPIHANAIGLATVGIILLLVIEEILSLFI